MRRWLPVASMVIAVTTAVAQYAAADPHLRQVFASPLHGETVTRLQAAPAQPYLQVCDLGNLNQPGFSINNFLLPPEEYQLTFDPVATCSACPLGFHVEEIHILLQFPGACSIQLAANLTEPDLRASGACPPPGNSLCESQTYLVGIQEAGLYDVVLPVTCDCAFVNGYRYNLSIAVLSMSCNASLITDSLPTACTSWNNFGLGWDDLVTAYQGWPGNLAIWANATCCENPLPNAGPSWGAIKSLYGASRN